MNTRQLLVAALLASLAAPGLAAPRLAEEAAGQPQATQRSAARDGGFQIDAPHMFVVSRGPRPIKNAPYSAQMVTERQQNLADGNQIADRQVTMAYRDSAGRTRQEVDDGKGETRLVTIHDPVAGVTWILKPQERTATRIARDEARAAGEAARKAAEAARARAEQAREEGRKEVIVKRVARADGIPSDAALKDIQIQISRAMQEKSAAMSAMQARVAPLATGAFGDMKWARNAVTKDLGAREFNGVKAEGRLRSYEIPAGEIGNRNPIVVSDETWFAPELQVTVYTKHSDPRSGDSVFRLDKLKREEPAASLFAVPADYTVKDPLAARASKAE